MAEHTHHHSKRGSLQATNLVRYGINAHLIGIFTMPSLQSLLHLDHSVGLFTPVKTRLPKTVNNRLASHIPVPLSYQSPSPLPVHITLMKLITKFKCLPITIYVLDMFSGDLAYIRPLKVPKRRTIIIVEMTDFSDKQRKRDRIENGRKSIQDKNQNMPSSRVIR